MLFIADQEVAEAFCLHVVDVLLRVVVDYDLEVAGDGPHQEVELPSSLRVDPAIHQISFFVCHYRVRGVFENAPG